MARRPVSVCAVDSRLVVVCDDGSVFESHPNTGVWAEWNPIPGSEADSD